MTAPFVKVTELHDSHSEVVAYEGSYIVHAKSGSMEVDHFLPPEAQPGPMTDGYSARGKKGYFKITVEFVPNASQPKGKKK